MSAPVWQARYRVEAHGARPGGEVHLAEVFRFLQDAAADHAHHLGFSIRELGPRGLSWVLLRFTLVLDRYPVWTTIHLESRRAVPLPETLHSVHLPARPRVLEPEGIRIRLPECPPDAQITLPVLPTDLDMNGHANSARMVEWLLAPALELRAGQPRRLDLEFRREGRVGTTVVSEVYARGETVFHRLREHPDGPILALARTLWPPS